jgi:hypothetical protein
MANRGIASVCWWAGTSGESESSIAAYYGILTVREYVVAEAAAAEQYKRNNQPAEAAAAEQYKRNNQPAGFGHGPSYYNLGKAVQATYGCQAYHGKWY